MSSSSRATAHDRKVSYKAPPATVRDASSSQEARRQKALEEQKRRRAERFDSARQLDFFADLTLGPSDDEDEDARGPERAREGVAQFAALLPPASTSTPAPAPAHAPASPPADPAAPDALPAAFGPKKKGKGRRKGKARGGAAKGAAPARANKWADVCMYAELLEMAEDPTAGAFGDGDGVPGDLERAWVAVAPVPVGKRCLAITHAPSGVAGLVPNTTLRSRVLGKCLMKPFPSAIPPHTVLDCILDENWKDNGILHVLDVIKWKGQDIADCETPFRFWWRDTRLSELTTFPPPSSDSEPSSSSYHFSYPTSLLPIPYHTNLSLDHLANVLIPLARTSRTLPISVPAYSSSATDVGDGDMDVEFDVSAKRVELRPEQAVVMSDGMLLYVAQATYEPGTSPLSLWIPRRAYTEDKDPGNGSGDVAVEGPLDVFDRLIRKRLLHGLTAMDDAMEA